MNILVVVPTYNEQLNITSMLESLRSVVPDADILVVDDGSPDGTAELAEEVRDRLGSISVLRRDRKNGLGGAYRAGFAWGLERGYDAFVEIDADFSHDPEALPRLLQSAQAGADLVIGSRYVPGGVIPDWSWHRKLLSRTGNLYASMMLRLGVKDSTAGYRVYRAGLLRRIDFETVQADGYGFQIEMTYRSRCVGASISEVPIRFVDRERGESKMSSTIIVEALALVTKWGFERIVGQSWKPPVAAS